MPYRKYSRRDPRRYFVQVRHCVAYRPPSETMETVILLAAALLWLWSGLATWHDLIGKPRDAPFLMIPGHIRSVCFWWIPAIFATYAAIRRRHVTVAFFILAVGAMVRFGSYLISWVVSWPWIDRYVPDDELKGDPRAWGSAWIYAAIIIGLGGFSYCCKIVRKYESKVVHLEADLANLNQREGAATNDS